LGPIVRKRRTLDTRHLILRAVLRHPALMLHAVLDKSRANLTLARLLSILRMDELFDEHRSRTRRPRRGDCRDALRFSERRDRS